MSDHCDDEMQRGASTPAPRRDRIQRASRELGRRDMYDVPDYIIAAMRAALDNLEHRGDGLTDDAVDDARDIVRTGKVSGEKAIKAYGFVERSTKQSGPMRDDKGRPTPRWVALRMWGDTGDRKSLGFWKRIRDRIEREGEMARGETHGEGIELRRHVAIDGDPLATDDDGTRVVHILRRGPLYDVDSGDKLLDVDDEMVSAIVENGNALIAAGQRIPVSREHGIERGQRGDTAGIPPDTRAYGRVLGFIADGDVYARVQWTDLGRKYLAGQRLGTKGPQGDETAAYISPRVMARFAHPDTGDELGRVVDVISLTTGPRQNGMDPVELSRGVPVAVDLDAEWSGAMSHGITCGIDSSGHVYIEQGDDSTNGDEPDPSDVMLRAFRAAMVEAQTRINSSPDTGEEVGHMAAEKTPTGAGVDVLLARGGDDTGRLLDALELSRGASAADIVGAVKALRSERDTVKAENVELARFKADTERKGREADAVTLLSRHGITDDAPEFDLYRDALADGGDFAEKVRGVLAKRGEVDLSRKVGEVFDAAVKRGAFAKSEKAKVVELARANPEAAKGIIAMIEARPDYAHTGKPSEAPGAGAANAAPVDDGDKTITGVELARKASAAAREKGAPDSPEYGAEFQRVQNEFINNGYKVV